MRYRELVLVSLLAVAAEGCGESPSDGTRGGSGLGPLGPCTPAPGFDCTNRINQVVLPLLARDGVEPVLAQETELCRRLAIDLSGVAPTWQDFQSHCAGKSAAEMVDYFMSQPAYQKVNQRLWADAFQYDNRSTWYSYIVDLDAKVGALYRGELAYADFAALASVHPAFTSKFVGENVVAYAFLAFLGRDARPEERQDMLGLYRMWRQRTAYDPRMTSNRYDMCTMGTTTCGADRTCRRALCIDAKGVTANACAADSDCTGGRTCQAYCFATNNYREVYLDPTRCAGALGPVLCSSAVHGVTVALPGTAPVAMSALTAAQREMLETPGRLLTRMSIFWEAAVDQVLHKYLGWWHGGYELPGYELPEVRQALALTLEQTGDLRALEREVLTSALYLMPAADPKSEVKYWHHGPFKQMLAETWLDSVGRLAGVNLGSCDARFAETSNRFLPAAYVPPRGAIGGVNYPAEARVMGGCPDQVAQSRYTDIGVLSIMEQRKIAAAACLDATATRLIPRAGIDGPGLVQSIYREAFTWDPDPSELGRTTSGMPALGTAAVAKQVAQNLCQAVVRSSRFGFY